MSMDYEGNAKKMASKYSLTMEVIDVEYKTHFIDDTQKRNVFTVKLSSGVTNKSYIFKFGDSIENTKENKKTLSIYSVLSCLQKYPVENDFIDFCNEYGYEINNENLKKIREIHVACMKEYKGFSSLFINDEIPEDILEIN